MAATGASAGSVNTSLAAFSTCLPRADKTNPTDSLLYKTWYDLDLKKLFPDGGSSVQVTSMFSQAPLMEAANRVQQSLVDKPQPWLKNCGSDLGFVTTRLKGRDVPLRADADASLTLKRLTEKFVMRFDTNGGADTSTSNFRFQYFTDTATSSPKLWLRPGTNHQNEPQFIDFRNVLMASTAFPAAFPPVQVQYHQRDGNLTGEFIDGGVFENVPVRLATRIVKERRGTDTSSRPVEYIVLSPEVTEWGRKLAQIGDESRSLPGVISSFAADFLSASRAAELLSVIDENESLQELHKPGDPDRPDGCDRLYMPKRRFKLASDHLLAFFGFMDERFRAFDFYLGMIGARDFVQSSDWTVTHPGEASIAKKVESAIDSRPYRCLTKLEAKFAHSAPNGDPTLRFAQFRRQFSLAEAQAVCGNDFKGSEPYVKLLRANIETSQRLLAEKKTLDDSDAFDIYLEALQNNKLTFKPYKQEFDAKHFAIWIRENLDKVIGSLSHRQPTFGSRVITGTGGRLASNLIVEYWEPPRGAQLGHQRQSRPRRVVGRGPWPIQSAPVRGRRPRARRRLRRLQPDLHVELRDRGIPVGHGALFGPMVGSRNRARGRRRIRPK